MILLRENQISRKTGSAHPHTTPNRIETALNRYSTAHGVSTDNLPPDFRFRQLIGEGFLKEGELQDPWGSPVRITDEDWHLADYPFYQYTVHSFGPDQAGGTADDLRVVFPVDARKWDDWLEFDGGEVLPPMANGGGPGGGDVPTRSERRRLHVLAAHGER